MADVSERDKQKAEELTAQWEAEYNSELPRNDIKTFTRDRLAAALAEQRGAAIKARHSVIADSELSDIEEEYTRWLNRLSGVDKGPPENCAKFLANYASVLVKAIRASESEAAAIRSGGKGEK